MNNYALLFPGQGSQYSGMGKIVYTQYPWIQHIFHEASDALSFDLLKVCFESSEKELQRTVFSQPCIVAVSYAYFKIFEKEFSLTPSYFAGHSIGEITALVCSGILPFADGIKLASNRAELMNSAIKQSPGKMLAVHGIAPSLIEAYCVDISDDLHNISVSNYNSPLQTVVSGGEVPIGELRKLLNSKRIANTVLNVEGAFHSNYMLSASRSFNDILTVYKFNEPTLPVISNVTALPYATANSIRLLLPLQIIKPVQWSGISSYFKMSGINNFIEVGPKNILKKLTYQSIENANCISFEDDFRLEHIRQFFSSENKEYTLYRQKCLTLSATMPNYGLNNHLYDKMLVNIQKLKLDETKKTVIPMTLAEADEFLESCMTAKNVTASEKNYWRDLLRS